MTTLQKTVSSLLAAVLLVGIFAVLAFTGLFDLLETRFYNPSIVTSVTRDNIRTAEVTDQFLTIMQDRLSAILKMPAIRSSLLPNQDLWNVLDRDRINNIFVELSGAVQWVRFIDSGGVKIHFSSYAPDILDQEGQLLTYRNYYEPNFPYEKIAVFDEGASKFTFDDRSARILLSFPMFDSNSIYKGTALFSLSLNTILDQLVVQGRIRFGQDAIVISNPPGLLFGTTAFGERAMTSEISDIWREEEQKTALLVSPISGRSLVLVSAKSSQGFFIGRVVNEELFSFPETMKFILLAVFFITVFLIVFLILNLRQDALVLVQNRIRKLQISLIEQFLELKGEADWNRWMRDLELRRNEIIVEVKQGINIAPGDESAGIDVIINKSWDELLSVLYGHETAGIDEEKLKSVMKRILADLLKTSIPQSSLFPVNQSAAVSANTGKPSLLMKAAAIIKEIEETETVEELEEAEEPEDINELASKIEFSLLPESDSSEDETINEDMEIVSPFSSMFDDFSDPDDEGIIEEVKGVPQVSDGILKPDSAAAITLNKDFKDLVDSVIK